jgi:hypothetical protein
MQPRAAIKTVGAFERKEKNVLVVQESPSALDGLA